MTLDELKKLAEEYGHEERVSVGRNTLLKLLEMIALKDTALDIFRSALDESAPESMLEPAFDASRRADEIERSL